MGLGSEKEHLPLGFYFCDQIQGARRINWLIVADVFIQHDYIILYYCSIHAVHSAYRPLLL